MTAGVDLADLRRSPSRFWFCLNSHVALGFVNTEAPLPTASVVIVELGTNDEEIADPIFNGAYQALMARVRYDEPGARLVCLGLWRETTPANTAREVFMQGQCQEQQGIWISLLTLFAVESYHGAAGRQTWAGAADWFHPDDAGHMAIAQAILQTIE